MTGWEPVVRAVEQVLRDTLPGKLGEVAARYTDQVPLPEPARYFLHAEETNNEWPAVYIIPGDEATPEDQSGGWTTTQRPFVVAVEFEGDDTASMAVALMRYETAVLEVVLRPPPAAPMHAVLWAGTIPGDIFQLGQGAAYRSWVEMTFIAKVFEEHLT